MNAYDRLYIESLQSSTADAAVKLAQANNASGSPNLGIIISCAIVIIAIGAFMYIKNTGKAERHAEEIKGGGAITRQAAALLVCAGILMVYGLAMAAMGWKHGGGAIPVIIVLVALRYAWKSITGTKATDQ